MLGQKLDRDTVRRVAGAKLNGILQVLRRRGLLAMTALRLVPLAPFAVEGVVAGAVRVKLWDFMIGTAIGHPARHADLDRVRRSVAGLARRSEPRSTTG